MWCVKNNKETRAANNSKRQQHRQNEAELNKTIIIIPKFVEIINNNTKAIMRTTKQTDSLGNYARYRFGSHNIIHWFQKQYIDPIQTSCLGNLDDVVLGFWTRLNLAS